MSFTDIPDELRGKTPAQLEDIRDYLDEHLRALVTNERGEIRHMTEVEQSMHDEGFRIRNRANELIEEHASVLEQLSKRPTVREAAHFNTNRGVDDFGSIRQLTVSQARDRALRLLDDRNATADMTAPQKDAVERQVRRYTDIARRVLVTENDDYRSAWAKLMTSPRPFLSAEETNAMVAWEEYRAMAEGTNSGADGGYGIPVFIDPSIILTDQETDNPFLSIASQKTVNTNRWKGVSAAGVAWSFDDEAEEVSDDSITLAQPDVDIFTARGFIPYSIELGMDYPDFAGEMARLLAIGYDELLIDKFSRGSGTGEPKGILTALDANSNVEVVVGTDGAFSAPDLYKVWDALPQKYRRRASWLMSTNVNSLIRQFGTANVFHAVTTTLPEGWAGELNRRPVYESPYFPSFSGTTGAANILVVGDFMNYAVVRNGGMSVELVQHLFGATNQRPTGQRGWFAYARIGGDSVNDAGFRLLQNQ